MNIVNKNNYMNNEKIVDADKKCLHDHYNEKLVSSGLAKTLTEAAQIPRMLSCTCKKCRPFYM